MRNAAVEQLAKLLSDTPDDSDENSGWRPLRRITLDLSLPEGWFSFVLVVAIVYTTIWSVQAAAWVDHMEVLTLTTAIGLVCGIVAIKQRWLSHLLVHGLVLVLGVLLAFWQTAEAYDHGSFAALARALVNWVGVIFNGISGNDDSIFLFLIILLGFALAYASVWLVYHLRSPWLMIVVNAIMFLINLSNVSADYVILLPIFLLASLLLLLRFNLYESIKRWNRLGLRYSDDLSWDVMQAGVLISIGILILSWILPWTYENPLAAQIWSANANPLVQVVNTWNRVVALNGGANPANHGNFRDTLLLGSNPNLTNDVVYTVQTDAANPSYLAFVSYDQYRAGQWSIGNNITQSDPIPANIVFAPSSQMTHAVKQTITIVNPPGEQYPYIIGDYQVTSINQPSRFLYGDDGTIIAWLGKSGRLPAGTTYQVESAVSSADVTTLRSVPMPQHAPAYVPPRQLGDDVEVPPPINAYNPDVLQAYTQMSQDADLNAFLRQDATTITADATTMYDKAVALETYLHNNYKYNVNVNPPPGQDPVKWFLTQGRQGFCNYFASAMVLFARSLGMPARVVAGYAVQQNDYDTQKHAYVIRGVEAHTWTQIYFAGYGWVDFEPSASFAPFVRPAPHQYTSGTSDTNTNTATQQFPTATRKPRTLPTSGRGASTGAQTNNALLLGRDVGLGLGGLVVLGLFAVLLFSLWWRRLFRHFTLSAQLYSRVCLLAEWAGLKLQPAQTPYEYLQDLTISALPASSDAQAIERLGDIYVRERWADPKSEEHPRISGEIAELPGLWQRLQPRLFLYVLRHPYFLRWLPNRVSRWLRHVQNRREQHRRQMAEEDF